MSDVEDKSKNQKSLFPWVGGPLGLGDPDDLSLRKVEKDILLPKRLKEEAKKRCSETLNDFLDCAKREGLFVIFKCQEDNNKHNECLLRWLKNPDFVKEQLSTEMSTIPHGAFAAFKIRQTLENSNKTGCHDDKFKFRHHFLETESGLEQPLKYSSQLMNSIWGLYNQYSVHNFKKNKDSADFDVFSNQCM